MKGHKRPKFLDMNPNLHIVVSSPDSEFRKFDLVELEPGNTSLVRRCTSLNTLAKISRQEEIQSADWREYRPLKLPPDSRLSSFLRPLDKVAVTRVKTAISALHGLRVPVEEGVRLVVLGANRAGDEFLALAPSTMELLWVSSTEPDMLIV